MAVPVEGENPSKARDEKEIKRNYDQNSIGEESHALEVERFPIFHKCWKDFNDENGVDEIRKDDPIGKAHEGLKFHILNFILRFYRLTLSFTLGSAFSYKKLLKSSTKLKTLPFILIFFIRLIFLFAAYRIIV